jgi:hypothetical protein
MHMFNAHPAVVDSDRILQDLTTRQFLRPHGRVEDVLAASAEKLGFCPRAADHAVRWLDIDLSQSVGRLRRTELTQLARSIHRFWRLAMSAQQSETSH